MVSQWWCSNGRGKTPAWMRWSRRTGGCVPCLSSWRSSASTIGVSMTGGAFHLSMPACNEKQRPSLLAERLGCMPRQSSPSSDEARHVCQNPGSCIHLPSRSLGDCCVGILRLRGPRWRRAMPSWRRSWSWQSTCRSRLARRCSGAPPSSLSTPATCTAQPPVRPFSLFSRPCTWHMWGSCRQADAHLICHYLHQKAGTNRCWNHLSGSMALKHLCSNA